MVVSGTANARAIAAVDSPPISRSVSATCAAGASAGWQQVKISRSESSRTLASSVWSGNATSAAVAWRSSRVASRRSRSIARWRAVVMIQPIGLGGTPVCGHRSSAAANASSTDSSASARSPQTRVSTATALP